jgi:hypothetical protein
MLKQIKAFLEENPGVKAKVIAAHLKVERQEANQVLYAHPLTFKKDSEHGWLLVSPSRLQIELVGQPWVTANDFEDALAKTTSPLDSSCSTVMVVLKQNCKLLLDAMARLLALCNQLAKSGRRVTIDFGDAKQTLS